MPSMTFPLALPIAMALMQVGPNPNVDNSIGVPEDFANRPPRPDSAASAPVDPGSAWLAECMALIESDPARAHSTAQIRRDGVSGVSRVLANHCLGLAATELAMWDDARSAFEAARDETPENERRARARFGLMAGNAALVGGEGARALALFDRAAADARRAASADLQAIAETDRARALVALDRPADGLEALGTATRIIPDDGEAWLLKATLLRRLERLAEAQTAIERAAALSPKDAAVGLEAGVIAILSGREEAARASWQSVIDTQPQSTAANRAQQYLAQLGPTAQDKSRP